MKWQPGSTGWRPAASSAPLVPGPRGLSGRPLRGKEGSVPAGEAWDLEASCLSRLCKRCWRYRRGDGKTGPSLKTASKSSLWAASWKKRYFGTSGVSAVPPPASPEEAVLELQALFLSGGAGARVAWGHRPFSVPPSLPWLRKGEIAVQRTGSFCALLGSRVTRRASPWVS